MRNKSVIGGLVGVLILLIGSIITFDRTMAPAMWQVTSTIWLGSWGFKCLKDDK